MLARLFARPANVLVMDEPTNDLDIDTLELLEEYVADFPGTLLLVSHDRAFLDHVVTSLLVFRRQWRVRDFVGGYSDWIAFRDEHARTVARAAPIKPKAEVREPAKLRRLSYKDQRELNTLPETLERLEAEKQGIESQLSDATLYKSGPDLLNERLSRLSAISRELETGYARWSELETLTGRDQRP